MKFYLTVFFLMIAKCAFCQTNNLSTAKIDSITACIDSSKNYYCLIEDGTIEPIRKGIIKKIFTKKTGSFSNTYYSDRTTKELYKVVNIENLGNSTTTAYYFKGGSLIMAKITTGHNIPVDLALSSGQFYFLCDSLIKRTGNDFRAKPAFVLKNGKEFIKNWSYMQNMGAEHK